MKPSPQTLLTILFILFINPLSAIDIIVKGKVTNVNGDPIPGVSIIIKGTAKGVSSTATGEYSITVAEDSTLIFSSVGYESLEIPVAGRTEINITLQNSVKAIDQVVVIGYGTQRKRDLTGAVSSVNGSEITKQPVLTATQAIQGKVAGVQIVSSGAPNSAPIVRIRGTGSILLGDAPLYVVDGVITEDIRNINSADILSMDVLKDASSAAIYGVRAANGVVIITTKKGRGGKMQVSYDANLGYREVSNLVEMANSTEYASYINDGTGNGTILIDPALTSTNTNWFETILRKGFQQNHNVSLSGGTDKGNYFFSVGYLTDEGVVINNDFTRFTLRSNNEYRLSSKVKVNALLSYSNGNTQDVNLSSAYNNAYHAAPVIQSKENGKYGNTSAFQNVGNPLLDIESNNNKYQENRLQGTGSFEYKPITWLTLKTSFGAEMAFNHRRVYTYQFLADTTTFLTTGGSQRNSKSNLALTEERNNRWVWDNTATYQKSFDDHDITVLVGFTAEENNTRNTTESRSDVPPDPDLWYLSQGDPGSQLNNSVQDKWTRESYIARINYAYKRKFLVTGTFRRDGSSLFDIHYANSPSIGLGWIITKEKFMDDQKIFDNLKLRASYGELGNDNVPSVARFVTLNIGLPYVFNGTLVNNGASLSAFVDKNIKWETTEEFDIGVEFGMFTNRLSGELDFYQKKVKDALLQVPAPSTTGTSLVYTNVASIENKGVELSLNWSDKAWENSTYNISGNVSYNKNEVIALNGGQAIFSGSVGSKGNTTYTSNNEPIGSFYLLQAEGVFHNQAELAAYTTSTGALIRIDGQVPELGDLKYKDLNDDGIINDKDRAFSGSYQPKFITGLNFGANWKTLDFSISFYGSFGSKIYNGKKEARFNLKDNIEASEANDRWTFANYTSNVPAASLASLPHSTYFLETG